MKKYYRILYHINGIGGSLRRCSALDPFYSKKCAVGGDQPVFDQLTGLPAPVAACPARRNDRYRSCGQPAGRVSEEQYCKRRAMIALNWTGVGGGG